MMGQRVQDRQLAVLARCDAVLARRSAKHQSVTGASLIHKRFAPSMAQIEASIKAHRPYQPKTGVRCSCRYGTVERDNCPVCEGTGWRIDFAAIRARNLTRKEGRQ